jgi:outer membrane protein assembly factor BamB
MSHFTLEYKRSFIYNRTMGRQVRLLAIVFAALSAIQAEDWNRFRGPNGSGVLAGVTLPSRLENPVWRRPLPFARSSPVIAGDRIFATASDGGKLITFAFDRATGKIQWRREIVPPRVATIYKANDAASPTPATDGKNVYAFFADLGLVSYGPDGNERWRVPLGPFDTFYGLGASPVVANDTLVMVCDDRSRPFIIAVDTATGKTRWRIDRKDTTYEGYSTPVVYEPKGQPAQVVVLGAHRIDAYDLKSGEMVWWFKGIAYFPIASPVIVKAGGNDVLIATSFGMDGPSGPSFDDMLKKRDTNHDGKLSREELKDEGEYYDQFGAFDYNNNGFMEAEEFAKLMGGAKGDYGMVAIKLGGKGDLTKQGYLWRETKNYSNMSSPLIRQDVVYIIKSGGIIAALDLATGKAHKVGRTKDAIDEYWASPVAAGDRLLFVSATGKASVLKAGSEWEVLGVTDLKEDVFATPAMGGGMIFIRTREALYAFRAAL